MLATWQFRIRHSLMESFDPRARWIFSLLFLFSISLFWDVRFLAGFFILAFTWYASARVSFKDTRRAWILITFILVMMVFVGTIITGGGAAGIIPENTHPLVTWNWQVPLVGWPILFRLTYERLWFALAQFLRVLSISAIFVIIPYSMDPRLYGFTFRGLGLPDRVAYAMDLAFRYVPTLSRDFGVTLDAQRARGYEIERVEGGILQQVRKVAPLIVPVTMNSIISGEDVTNAMDLRCFGIKPRTWLEKTTFRRRDYVLLAFTAVMLVGSIILCTVFHFGVFWMPAWLIPG
ncbi:MAG: energy-coupling factor transporter transmembrane protein EcfT [Anaerolineaceae bacterium]